MTKLCSKKCPLWGGEQSEPIYSIGHDERSAGLKPNVVDPLTRKDYLRSPVVAQPINNKG